MSEPTFDRPPAAVPLDRETLLARFDQIRQFARGGRRAPHKPLLLLYALARLKHDRQTEVRFNATEAVVNPLLRSYGPWGSGAPVSYPYGRLVNDGLWHLPDCVRLLDATGNVREGVARERAAPAGFTPDVLATFKREPELIDVAALHLLERHFAPGLHDEILGAVGLELGTPVATRRRYMAFRPAVLEAYFTECCLCGFSLRLVDGLIGVDAAHIRWHAHGGPDEVPNGLALCACTIAYSTTGPSQCARTCGCGSHDPWLEARHAICSLSLMVSRCGCRLTNNSTRAASTLRWHQQLGPGHAKGGPGCNERRPGCR